MYFGKTSIDTNSYSAFSNSFQNATLFCETLYNKEVTAENIEKTLNEVYVSKYGQYLYIYSFRPDSQYCLAGPKDDKTRTIHGNLIIKWDGLKNISKESTMTDKPYVKER